MGDGYHQGVLSLIESEETAKQVQDRIKSCERAISGFEDLPRERRRQKKMLSLFKFLREWAVELGAGDVKTVPSEQGGGTSCLMFRFQGSSETCMLAYLNVDCVIGQEEEDAGRKGQAEGPGVVGIDDSAILRAATPGLVSTCLFLHAMETYKQSCSNLPISVQVIVDGEFAGGSTWLAKSRLRRVDGQGNRDLQSQLRTRGGSRQRKKKSAEQEQEQEKEQEQEQEELLRDTPCFVTMFSALPWMFDDQPTIWLGAGGSLVADVEISPRCEEGAGAGGEFYIPSSFAAGIVDEPTARLSLLLLSVLDGNGELMQSLRREGKEVAGARLSDENVRLIATCMRRHGCRCLVREGREEEVQQQQGENQHNEQGKEGEELKEEEEEEEEVRRRLSTAWFSCEIVTERVAVGSCKEINARASLRLPLGYTTSRREEEEEEERMSWQHNFQHNGRSFGVPPHTATHAHARIKIFLPAGWTADSVLDRLQGRLEEGEGGRVKLLRTRQLLPPVESRRESINIKAMHMSLLKTFGKHPLLAYSRRAVPAASRVQRQTGAPVYFFSPLPPSRLLLVDYLEGLKCSVRYIDAIFHLVK
eukprot:600467-Hanusia_phi.AAC.2